MNLLWSSWLAWTTHTYIKILPIWPFSQWMSLNVSYHPLVAIFELDNLIISVIWPNPFVQSLTLNFCFHPFILSSSVKFLQHNECFSFFWLKIFIIRCHSTQRLHEPHHWDDKNMDLNQRDSSSVYWIPAWDEMQDKCSCSPILHLIAIWMSVWRKGGFNHR